MDVEYENTDNYIPTKSHCNSAPHSTGKWRLETWTFMTPSAIRSIVHDRHDRQMTGMYLICHGLFLSRDRRAMLAGGYSQEPLGGGNEPERTCEGVLSSSSPCCSVTCIRLGVESFFHVDGGEKSSRDPSTKSLCGF